MWPFGNATQCETTKNIQHQPPDPQKVTLREVYISKDLKPGFIPGFPSGLKRVAYFFAKCRIQSTKMPDFQRGNEERAAEDGPVFIQHNINPLLQLEFSKRRKAQFQIHLIHDRTERRGPEIIPGFEMVMDGAPRDTGPLRDILDGGFDVAALDQQFDCGTEQCRPSQRGALLLGSSSCSG